MDENFWWLAIASAVFVLAHVGISSTPLRGKLVAAVGEGPYLGLFSLVATATLTWMILAYAAAPPIALWAHVTAFRTVPLVVMPFALILLVAGLTVRNPAGVGGERGFRGEDAAHGILRVTRHPLQAAILLWAAAHVLANGDLSSLLFFGGFFVLSSWGTVLIDRKRKAALGRDWEAYMRATSTLPFAAILAGRNHFRPGEIGWWRGAVGLLLYGALIAVHRFLFGVFPY